MDRFGRNDLALDQSLTLKQKMPCHFYTAKFVRCTHNVRGGGDYCGVHQAKAERLGVRPAEHLCHCVRYIDGADQWCGGARMAGEDVCQWHQQRRTAREAREQHQRDETELIRLNTIAYAEGDMTWQEIARDCRARMHLPREDAAHLSDFTAFRIARNCYRRRVEFQEAHEFPTFWVDLWREEQGLPPMAVADIHWGVVHDVPQADPAPAQPQGQMARLARDTQNVHTAQVAKQTNGNLEILLEAKPYEGQDTLSILTRWWLFRPKPAFEDYWRVMQDVHHWYHARTCKKTNDHLYQRVLDGLVVKILLATDDESKEKDELFVELVKRLWEECEEAVGMCCEGHLARLANVLVGFDEAFKPPVPVGEILQQKMADIAQLKISHKLKLQKAVAVMDELAIPVADRDPWLEALEA